MGINRFCGCGREAMRSENVQRRSVSRKDEEGEAEEEEDGGWEHMLSDQDEQNLLRKYVE